MLQLSNQSVRGIFWGQALGKKRCLNSNVYEDSRPHCDYKITYFCHCSRFRGKCSHAREASRLARRRELKWEGREKGGAKRNRVKWILSSPPLSFLWASFLTNLHVISSLAVRPLRTVRVHSVPWNSAASERPPPRLKRSPIQLVQLTAASVLPKCPPESNCLDTLTFFRFTSRHWIMSQI